MKLVYLGTPDVAVPPLTALVGAGFDIELVVSGPDKRRGRGSSLHPSPVKTAAVDLGLDVTDHVDDLLGVDADLGVVVAYGHLIKPHILDEVPMVNLHFSLLPRWRGAAPVERAILAGDDETGVCLMALEEGLDTGGVYRRAVVPITADDTLETLRSELVELGSTMLVEALHEGLGIPEPQSGEPTYARKIQPEELHLDLERPAEELDRVIRLGRAWTTVGGKRLRVWSARTVDRDLDVGELASEKDVIVGTGRKALELLEVQPEGKGRMAAASWRNGAQLETGDRLGR